MNPDAQKRGARVDLGAIADALGASIEIKRQPSWGLDSGRWRIELRHDGDDDDVLSDVPRVINAQGETLEEALDVAAGNVELMLTKAIEHRQTRVGAIEERLAGVRAGRGRA